MVLEAGNQNADTGMSNAIYKSIEQNLGPAFPDGPTGAVQNGWKKLAYAIAVGIVDHIKDNIEIKGITTSGKITQMNVETTFIQSDDGTGHVE